VRRWLALAVALAGCSGGPVSDWERQQEGKLAPEAAAPLPPNPPYPRRGDLVEFKIGTTSELRYFIDAASLTVGKDGVVYYVLVALGPAGAENVSFEGMRCASGEARIFAIGHGGGWGGRPGAWRTIQFGVQHWHDTLYREYLCRYRQPPRDAKAAIDALRN